MTSFRWLVEGEISKAEDDDAGKAGGSSKTEEHEDSKVEGGAPVGK